MSDVVKASEEADGKHRKKRKMKREGRKNRCRVTERGKVHVNLQHVV